MSKDDSKPDGLFSKMVRFVRPTAVNGAEIAALTENLAESPHALRQMLERKRRNDAVRQREFNQLRELRQQQSAGDASALAPASELSLGLQSSLICASARAATLEKIDAIEEQMSEQWWRNKQPSDASTLPMELMLAIPTPGSVQVAAAPDAPSWGAQLAASAQPARLMLAEESTTFATTELRDPPVWDAAEPFALPPAVEFVHDAEFEQAAIAFADGNVAGAEASLLELLAQRAAEPARQQSVWLALFDLYRAADLGDRFELQAIDFAARFGRLAPLWFSLPAQLGLPHQAAAKPAAAWRWSAPVVLTRQSVAALQAAKNRAPAPWTMVWTALEQIEEDAVPLLERVITQWAQTPGQIRFVDAPLLVQRLQALTLPGRREASACSWLLRMAVLRLIEQHESFDLAALDYCITYEVSPPSWTAPKSSYVDGLSAVQPELAASAVPGSSLLGVGLAGCIDSEAAVWLAALEAQAKPGVPLVVDCSQLIRLDFAAAGAVLNWSAHMQAKGYLLRFDQLHRLVAVFFAMIGIHEHAQLVARSD